MILFKTVNGMYLPRKTNIEGQEHLIKLTNSCIKLFQQNGR